MTYKMLQISGNIKLFLKKTALEDFKRRKMGFQSNNFNLK
jgi:hypothetical protein